MTLAYTPEFVKLLREMLIDDENSRMDCIQLDMKLNLYLKLQNKRVALICKPDFILQFIPNELGDKKNT